MFVNRPAARRNNYAGAVAFASIGHTSIHMFTAFYFVIVLGIETDWQLPYPDLIELWTLGALLVGLAALPAGWLADRWSATGMLVVFFVGLGISSVMAALARSSGELMMALSCLGLFAAIYHPVGIPWLVRNTPPTSRGKALGFNGAFGGLGAALAAVTAGLLVEHYDWRTAFMVPGVIAIGIGLVLTGCVFKGWIGDQPEKMPTDDTATSGNPLQLFALLLAAMVIGGLIYHTTQIGLPRLFLERASGLFSSGIAGIGIAVGIVYTLAGITQMAGGHLADKLPLKSIYLGGYLLQVPLLILAAVAGGIPLLLVAVLMVAINTGILPAENLLLAVNTPTRHHGMAFGLKFVLTFGLGPIAVQFIAWATDGSGGLAMVFGALAACGLLGVGLVYWLPADSATGRAASPSNT